MKDSILGRSESVRQRQVDCFLQIAFPDGALLQFVAFGLKGFTATMYFKENDSTGVRRVEGVHEGRGAIQVRSFFDGQSRLGTRFHVWELDPGTSEGAHIHEEEGALEEIYYFTQGRGRMWIGDDRVDVAAGDAILVPAGVPHGFENNGTSPLRVVLFFGKPQAGQPSSWTQARSGAGARDRGRP